MNPRVNKLRFLLCVVSVESTGIYTAKELLLEAVKVLRRKCTDLMDELDKVEG